MKQAPVNTQLPLPLSHGSYLSAPLIVTKTWNFPRSRSIGNSATAFARSLQWSKWLVGATTSTKNYKPMKESFLNAGASLAKKKTATISFTIPESKKSRRWSGTICTGQGNITHNLNEAARALELVSQTQEGRMSYAINSAPSVFTSEHSWRGIAQASDAFMHWWEDFTLLQIYC